MACQKLFILIPISKKIFPMLYSLGNKIANISDMLHLGENSRTPGRNTILHIDMFLRILTTNTVLRILIRCKMSFSFVLSTVPCTYQGLQSMRWSCQRNKKPWHGQTIKGHCSAKPWTAESFSSSPTPSAAALDGDAQGGHGIDRAPFVTQPQLPSSCCSDLITTAPCNLQHLEANLSQTGSLY